MSDYLFFVNLFEKAMTERDKEKLIWDILTPLSTHLSGYLSNPKNSLLQKLGLILTISRILQRFIETSSLLRDFFRVGCQVNITIICREICFNARSFPELIDQSAYTAALLKFTSSGFPPLLADLPLFLKTNLLDKYETLKRKPPKLLPLLKKPNSSWEELLSEQLLPNTGLKFQQNICQLWKREGVCEENSGMSLFLQGRL